VLFSSAIPTTNAKMLRRHAGRPAFLKIYKFCRFPYVVGRKSFSLAAIFAILIAPGTIIQLSRS
jgi:hypothetical protein